MLNPVQVNKLSISLGKRGLWLIYFITLFPFWKKGDKIGSISVVNCRADLCQDIYRGMPQYHPPKADKSAGATPMK